MALKCYLHVTDSALDGCCYLNLKAAGIAFLHDQHSPMFSAASKLFISQMDHLFNFAGVIWLLRGLLYMKQLGVLEIISKSLKFCSHLEAGTPCKCLCKMPISFTCKVAFNQLIPWLVICFFKMRNSGL